MSEETVYTIDDRPLAGTLELLDVQKVIDETTERWANRTLCRVDDVVVRLGVLQGEFHWHKHDDEDECFIVLDGELIIDIEGRGSITLERHRGYTIPKGIVHRTRANERTTCLMVEAAGVVPTGD